MRRLRRYPIAAYGIAVGVVALVTALRLGFDTELLSGLPFITYYPAIIVATLIGGFGPGFLAIILSALSAWFLFLPPAGAWQLDAQTAFTLLLFIVLSVLNVLIIWFLDLMLGRTMTQEQNVRVLIESAPNGIVVVDEQGRIQLVNASTERLFGYVRGELLCKNIEVLVPAPQAEAHRSLRGAYQERPEGRPMGAGRDLSGRRKDGSEFPVEIGLNPVATDGQRAVLATVVDISARKRVHESQRLLIRELQHRTRNLFAVIRSISDNTLFTGRPLAEARYVFNNRLQALARAYELVADAALEGASLSQILERQFAGFSSRVSVSGCEIVVGVVAAQQFALITHELATNALKYGALSSTEGSVSIEGTIERVNGERIFWFVWRETGGPTVSPPVSRGFGSVILEEAARQFANSVTMTFAPEGLIYELRLNLDAAQADVRPAQ